MVADMHRLEDAARLAMGSLETADPAVQIQTVSGPNFRHPAIGLVVALVALGLVVLAF